jgi:hypothetical protein
MNNKHSTSSDGSERQKRLWNIAVAALALSASLLLVIRTAADPDLWGHVLFGLDLLRTGTLPETDPYSYVSYGHPWINHELLSELAFGLSYRTAGTFGLMLLKAVVAMSLVGLLFRHLIRRGLPTVRAAIVLILTVFAMLTAIGTLRPHLFTLLFFLMTLLVIERAQRGQPRWLWALPPIFALWINFHGGVLAGIGILVLWAGIRVVLSMWKPDLVGKSGASRALLAGVLGASFIALLLNPYLWKLPYFLFTTATVPRPDISEWHPVGITTVPGVLYLSLVAVMLLVRDQVRARPVLWLTVAATALLPLMAIRHLSLFALTFGVFLAEPIALAWAGRSQPEVSGEGEEQSDADGGPMGAHDGESDEAAKPEPRRSLIQPALVGASLFAALMFVGSSVPAFRCIPIRPGPSIGFPSRAIGLLKASGAEGNLAIHFNYGEYAIWHLSGRFPVSMDGRRETVYSDSIYSEALRFQGGTGDWDAILDDHPTDLALVPRRTPTYNLLRLKPGWNLAYQDTLVGVFAREGWPGAELLAATDPPNVPVNGDGLCFPR